MLQIYWERYSHYKKQSFIFIYGEDDVNIVFWVGKCLLLIRLRTARCGTGILQEVDFSYIQFMEVTKTISCFDNALGCFFLR